MSIKQIIKTTVKRIIYATPITRDYAHGAILYRKFGRSGKAHGCGSFLLEYGSRFHLEPLRSSKARQIAGLMSNVDICPTASSDFFYSLDCMKTIQNTNSIFSNCTANYDAVVNGSLREISDDLAKTDDRFSQEEQIIIAALSGYLENCYRTTEVAGKYGRQLDAIETLFHRPAKSFFEALQRILFFNQFLWQTGHALNGLGHLDWILYNLYRHDLSNGVLTRKAAADLLKDFFKVLHDNYWFKSSMLLGDTGQIIILGGRDQDGQYHCNDLTYLFIEVSKELHLPDPKVLLRCTADMPEDLLELAVDCIATGIGAPLLANDDEIILAMLSCGYDAVDVHDYGVSACWEPLIPGLSFEPNNVASLNFAEPFTRMADSPKFDSAKSMRDIISLYVASLREYIAELLIPLTTKPFEEDPLLSLLSPSCVERGKDITQGGAKYNNLGVTSVGLGCVVNSILNLDKLVFSEGKLTLAELNDTRKRNFVGKDELVEELKGLSPAFGSDSEIVVELAKYLLAFTSSEFKKYKTPYGGVFKFGLSSPNYINGADKVPATFDGRRNGDPFSVHISSASAIPTTELISFAMKLDYRENRLNGNVIDFITSPGTLQNNREKYAALLRAGFAGGIFQLQMNVVDSKTLIAAKADPTLFPNLVVRVWGFSAYFNDLPEEYKDVLIKRALESEKAA